MTATSPESVEGSRISIHGTECFVHHWKPAADVDRPKGLVVIFHGFLAHGGYPTVRYAAEFLSDAQYAVVAIDFPGHGRSEGLPGYIASADNMVSDGVAMVEYARSLYNHNDDDGGGNNAPRLILCGSSMGGAIALAVAQRLKDEQNLAPPLSQSPREGLEPLVVLLAPMLKLGVSSVEHIALQCLAVVTPTVQLIPSSATDASKQYRDAIKCQECEDDELTMGGRLRVASALTCVDLTLQVQALATSITCPYLLMIADEDVVVKNEGANSLWEQSVECVDKTKKHYPALHGLLCEPSPLFDQIQKDILDWLNERV